MQPCRRSGVAQPPENAPLYELLFWCKVLTEPRVGTDVMVRRAQEVFQQAGVTVGIVKISDLRPAEAWVRLNDLTVGRCNPGDHLTEEQTELFHYATSQNGRHVEAFFVRSTRPPYNGCAVHPPDKPGVTIAAGATQWTLAHELGHVFGLQHVHDKQRLMTRATRSLPENALPKLSPSEVNTIRTSKILNS